MTTREPEDNIEEYLDNADSEAFAEVVNQEFKNKYGINALKKLLQNTERYDGFDDEYHAYFDREDF